MALHFTRKRTEHYLVYQWLPNTERKLGGCLAHITATGGETSQDVGEAFFARRPDAGPVAVVYVTALSLVVQGRSASVDATVFLRPGAWGMPTPLDLAAQHALGATYREFLDREAATAKAFLDRHRSNRARAQRLRRPTP
jgi:hypothetical protein